MWRGVCVSSNRHPLGAVWCNSEGRGSSHVPRDSKIVRENTETGRSWGMRPKLKLCILWIQFGEALARWCFTFSVDRECHFVLISFLFLGVLVCCGWLEHSCTLWFLETSVSASTHRVHWRLNPVTQTVLCYLCGVRSCMSCINYVSEERSG